MRRHFLTLRPVLPALTAVVSLTVVSVAGQAPATLRGFWYTAAPAK